MNVAVYARVSTERQANRGTIGSQLEALRAHVTAAGEELVGEYVDDGLSGARLDRPGLDALRDAAEAGLFETVYCLSPDRLARAYAYQVLVLDELTRFRVTVRFTDAPNLDADDPQARLLTQVQGVIAEYEKAKIAERYRRGKLFRARAGEITTWKAPYGYRRIPRNPSAPAHLQTYEPEAAVVRRIFADHLAGHTIREICRRLNADGVSSPTGKATWGHSTVGRLLRNEAYVGRVYYNRTESVPDPRPTRRNRQVRRPREEWIAIPCPRIIDDEAFEAAGVGQLEQHALLVADPAELGDLLPVHPPHGAGVDRPHQVDEQIHQRVSQLGQPAPAQHRQQRQAHLRRMVTAQRGRVLGHRAGPPPGWCAAPPRRRTGRQAARSRVPASAC